MTMTDEQLDDLSVTLEKLAMPMAALRANIMALVAELRRLRTMKRLDGNVTRDRDVAVQIATLALSRWEDVDRSDHSCKSNDYLGRNADEIAHLRQRLEQITDAGPSAKLSAESPALEMLVPDVAAVRSDRSFTSRAQRLAFRPERIYIENRPEVLRDAGDRFVEYEHEPLPEPIAKAFGVDINTPQPPPLPSSRTPTWDLVVAYAESRRNESAYGIDGTLDLVLADMRERDTIGRAKYGVALTSDNGRDHLVDAYQEALDLAVYLANELDKRGVILGPRRAILDSIYSDDLVKELRYGSGIPHTWCILNVFQDTMRHILTLRGIIRERDAALQAAPVAR
jgi:hypothetical protein